MNILSSIIGRVVRRAEGGQASVRRDWKVEVPERRRRGRPRKYPLPDSGLPQPPTAKPAQPQPRRRGRPRKRPYNASSDEEVDWQPPSRRRVAQATDSSVTRSVSVQSGLRVRRRTLALDKPLMVLSPKESEEMLLEEAREGTDFSLMPEDFEFLTAEGASFETDVAQGTREYDAIMQQKSVSGSTEQRFKANIDVPSFREVETETHLSPKEPFKFPEEPIRFDPKWVEDWGRSGDYCMDSDDAAFLAEYTKGRHAISDLRFEEIVEGLEHEAHRKRLQQDLPGYNYLREMRVAMDRLHILLDIAVRREKHKKQLLQLHAEEIDASLEPLRVDARVNRVSLRRSERRKSGLCRVCFVPGGSLNTCTVCAVSVHASCYGQGRPRRHGWLCDWCARSKGDQPAECQLCPVRGGAVKRTMANQWVHATCALFTPGVIVSGTPERVLQFDLSDVHPDRFRRRCTLCRKKTGAIIFCDQDGCDTGFHVMCAELAGYHLQVLPETEPPIETKIETRGSPELKQFTSFCGEHTPIEIMGLTDMVEFDFTRQEEPPLGRSAEDNVLLVDEDPAAAANGGTVSSLRRLFAAVEGVPSTPGTPRVGAGSVLPLPDGSFRPIISSRLPNLDEESAMCAVCGDGDSYDEDQIVFCDGCNLAVHQSCYGIDAVPSGDWFCARCQVGAGKVQCALCPVRTGAFKSTVDGRWVHVVCALWVPGMSFGRPDVMEDIVGLDRVDPAREKLLCYICRKRYGACIQCRERSCMLSFHVGCARHSDSAFLRLQETKNGELSYVAYCKIHKEIGQRDHLVREWRPSDAAIRMAISGGVVAMASQVEDAPPKRKRGRPPLARPAVSAGEPPTGPRQTREVSHGAGLSHFVPPPRHSGAMTSLPHMGDEDEVSTNLRLLHAQHVWDEKYLNQVSIYRVVKALRIVRQATVMAIAKHWVKKRLDLGRPLLDKYCVSLFNHAEVFRPFNPVDHPAFLPD